MDSSKKVSIIGYGITLLTFIIITLFGKFYVKPGQEMGYTLLNFYAISPGVCFAVGCVLGGRSTYLKWIYPIFSGMICLAVLMIIFPGSFDLIFLLFSFVPAIIGLFIGFSIGFILKYLKIQNKK